MSETPKQRLKQLTEDPKGYFEKARAETRPAAKEDAQREIDEAERRRRAHSASEGLGRRVINAVIERK